MTYTSFDCINNSNINFIMEKLLFEDLQLNY